MTIPVELGIEAAVRIIELGALLLPRIAVAIQSAGELTEETKALLIARVDAARAKVAAYVPRDV